MIPRAASPLSRETGWRSLACSAALVAIVVVVYAAALRGDFLWDDDSHVTANPVIIGPLGLREIWTTAAANYFPLVLTSFWLQHALWGLDPFGYHAVTLACHALAAVLLWRVLRRLRIPGAWLGAALWALHPVQVESVAWISELKNTQSAVFFLLSIWFWLRWLEDRRASVLQTPPRRSPEHGVCKTDALRYHLNHHYLLALASAFLALLSKPSTVMLPVVLALCAWWQHGEWRWRDLGRLAPFFALSLSAAGWTIWEQRFHSGALGAEWNQIFSERLVIAGRVLWFYFGKLAWPEGLSFIYPRWPIASTTAVDFLPLAAALAVLVGAWRLRHRGRAVFFAAAVFIALLFPVLGFFNVYFFRYSFVSDHFQYLASIGPLALAGAAVAQLPPKVGRLASAVALLGLGVLTWRQTAAFTNNEILWRTTLARHPDTPMAWLNLGATLAKQHREAEAIACFRRVAEHRPADADAQSDAGWGLLKAGYPEPAVPLLERAVQLDPNHREAHNTLANALRKLGRLADAIRHYTRHLELNPTSAEAHNNLGSADAETGRLPEAQAQFEAAIRLAPRFAPAHANLGTVQGLAGRWADAIGPLREALRLQPDYPDAHEKLAVALANTGRLLEAVPHFERALVLNPAATPVRQGYAQVLQRLGHEREATVLLQGEQPRP